MIIEDKNAYKKLLDKYNLDQAFYVKINQNISQNKVKVLMKFFDKNINKFKLIKQFEYFIEDNNNNDSTLNLLSEDILYKLDNWWKKENLINNSKINSIKCIIKSNNFDDFNFIKSNINDLSQVLTMRPIKIKINNNVEKIEYYGDIDILTKSLLSKGVTLVDPDNCSILSH